MRCKKHYTDLSSTIGVCACCLRERLLSLIAVEEEQATVNLDGKHRIPSTTPATVHNSHAPRHHHTLSDQQFYTTIPPAGIHNSNNKKKSLIRFFSFQHIFRSKTYSATSASSSSWLSTIIHGGRHRRKPSLESDLSGVIHHRDRGMSPVRNTDLEEDSQIEIVKTPKRTPQRRGGGGGGGGGHVRNLSFCLSPLVRASPNRQWNQSENAVSGEMRGPVKVKPPNLSNTKLFCANRSRKLADFGRTNPNR